MWQVTGTRMQLWQRGPPSGNRAFTDRSLPQREHVWGGRSRLEHASQRGASLWAKWQGRVRPQSAQTAVGGRKHRPQGRWSPLRRTMLAVRPQLVQGSWLAGSARVQG